jgi:hypothetical protein
MRHRAVVIDTIRRARGGTVCLCPINAAIRANGAVGDVCSVVERRGIERLLGCQGRDTADQAKSDTSECDDLHDRGHFLVNWSRTIIDAVDKRVLRAEKRSTTPVHIMLFGSNRNGQSPRSCIVRPLTAPRLARGRSTCRPGVTMARILFGLQ